MHPDVEKEAELTAILNLVPYMDTKMVEDGPVTLNEVVALCEEKFSGGADGQTSGQEPKYDTEKLSLLKTAIEQNPSIGEIELLHQSSTNTTDPWTDDLIQGCTFRDPATDNYYVAYRGTGDGRWPDNGRGLTAASTEMQEAAEDYFNQMAEEYFLDPNRNVNKVYLTGHSKGANEAQYVFMSSEYAYLVDGCYSYDGQGFSKAALVKFKHKNQSNYDEKLSKMYSICGENDFVNGLGLRIFRNDHVYFVNTFGTDGRGLHGLERMIGNGNGQYVGIQWNRKDGKIVNGEQGVIGRLVNRLTANMMEMDSEDLDGAAIAMMAIADYCMAKFDKYTQDYNDGPLGEVQPTLSDYWDLFTKGTPVVLETLFCSEEGEALIKSWVDGIYEKCGFGGVAGAFGGFCAGVAKCYSSVLDFLSDVEKWDFFEKVFDWVSNAVDKMKPSKKIKDVFADMKAATLKAIEKLTVTIKIKSAGQQYAGDNPKIVVDTYKLEAYAQRLQAVNNRLQNLDWRMDSLYWRVGLFDLWRLIQADLLTGYSWRLERCISYLNDTAADFAEAERAINGKL